MERFYIYSGRRWVELDVTAGRLAGRAGAVGFLCIRDGALHSVPREDVLSQLCARAAGRPSRVSRAAPLPAKRRRRRVRRPATHRSTTSEARDQRTRRHTKSPTAAPPHDAAPPHPSRAATPPRPRRAATPTRPHRTATPTLPRRAAPPPRPRRAAPRPRSPGPSEADDISQHEFAARLGLAPSPCRSSPVMPARRREYTAGEDRALLLWLAEGEDRARGVRGVAVWRRGEAELGARTGVRRTWHSLKNRYLRYLLPALHSQPLSETAKARLRTGAAPRPSPHASILLPRSPPRASASSRARRSVPVPAPASPPSTPSPRPRRRRALYNANAAPPSARSTPA